MPGALPTGTVSFLFTDVEDSTGLAQRLGVEFVPLMGEHFELIRGALRENNGVEVKSTGDGIFAAFATAADAVAAAVTVEKAISGHGWPPGGDVRVRIGIHTGEAVVADDDYVGLEVHRAARVMAAAHGGQVVVTEATRLLTTSGFEFKELGRHLLRGLEADELICQVIVPGLPAQFPPLRTATAIPNNLPTRLTSIIGRDDELDVLSNLVGENRLVTILGPGGVGKTSLALTVATRLVDRFNGGVVFVDLSSVSDPDLVVPSIAAELKVEPKTVEGIAERLGEAACLLVLDNFEQIESAAAEVGRLLGITSQIRVLVTSQVPLRLPGEKRYLLEPLDPDGSEGMRLFFERAEAAAPGFSGDQDEVRELIRYVGGLPLAIELMAARANILGPAQMLDRLRGDRMSYGTQTGRPERHRTLEEAIGWSYDLLSESTQEAFRRLSVFAGAMSIEAVEEIVRDTSIDALDELAELVDRSLVRRVVESSGRFTMLDGIRRFARSRLAESTEAREIEERFVVFYLNMSREAYAGLQSDRGEWWRAQLNDDLENLREVLSVLHRLGRRGDGLELLGNTWRFYQSRGYMVELEIWLNRFFTLPGAKADVGNIKGIMARSALLYWQKKPAEGVEGYREAVELARHLDDEALLADALYGLGTSLIVSGQTDSGAAPLDEAKGIYSRLGDESGLADVLAGEAFAKVYSSGWADAGPMFKQASEMYERVGRQTQAAQSIYAQAGAALTEDRLDDALEFALKGILRGRELSDVFLQAWGLEYVSRIQLDMENIEFAGLIAGAAAAAAGRIGGGWSPESIGIEDCKSKLAREVGKDEASRLMEPGRSLGIEEAVRKALGEGEA